MQSRNARGAAGVVGPAAYAAWRATVLGSITESIEQRLILELAGEVRGLRALDAGSGDGALACLIAQRGAEVVGIDVDPAMVAVARVRAAKAGLNVTLLEGRLERLPFGDETFDLVVAVTVLCFAPDGGAAVRELARVLKPGGRLVIGELGRCSSWAARRRICGWLGSQTWAAAHFRTGGDLKALVAQTGLYVGAIQGAVYYPPVGVLARVLAPTDGWLGRLTTFGAAFIAIVGIKRV